MKAAPLFVVLAVLISPGPLHAVDTQVQQVVAAAAKTWDGTDRIIRPTDTEEVRYAKADWKMENLVLAKVDIDHVPYDKAIVIVMNLGAQADPQHVGVAVGFSGKPKQLVTFSATNIKLKDAIEAVCAQGGYKYTLLSGTIDTEPADTNEPPELAKTFDVPPHFFTFDKEPELNKGKDANVPETRCVDVSNQMRARGVTFPRMGRALYYPKRETVSIVTTGDQFLTVEAMLKPSVKP